MRWMALVVALAGCAQGGTVTTWDGRFSEYRSISGQVRPADAPPPPADEGDELLREALTRRPLRDMMNERAERAVPPLPARATRADREQRERALHAERMRLYRALNAAMDRRERATAASDRLARQEEYCRDLAHSVYIGSAPLSEMLAGAALGYSSRQNSYYRNCMDGFARTDRYLGR